MLQQRQEVYAPCSERDCGQAPCGSGPPGNGPRPSLHRGRSEVRTGEDRSEGLTADPGPKLRPSTPRSPTLADTAKKRPHEAFADGWRHKRNVHGALFSLKQEWSPPPNYKRNDHVVQQFPLYLCSKELKAGSQETRAHPRP